MRRRNDQRLVELLDAQADRLVHGHMEATALLALYPELADEAGPLMALANALASALQPVRPRAAYRAHLRRGLVQAAQRRQALRAMTRRQSWLPRREWMWGAAALGSAVSLLGVVAYFVRSRHGGRAGQVISG